MSRANSFRKWVGAEIAPKWGYAKIIKSQNITGNTLIVVTLKANEFLGK